MIYEGEIKKEHISWLDELEFGKRPFPLNNKVRVLWLDIAIKCNRMRCVDMILDVLDVPKNMTTKERLCYYQLLSDK